MSFAERSEGEVKKKVYHVKAKRVDKQGNVKTYEYDTEYKIKPYQKKPKEQWGKVGRPKKERTEIDEKVKQLDKEKQKILLERWDTLIANL